MGTNNPIASAGFVQCASPTSPAYLGGRDIILSPKGHKAFVANLKRAKSTIDTSWKNQPAPSARIANKPNISVKATVNNLPNRLVKAGAPGSQKNAQSPLKERAVPPRPALNVVLPKLNKEQVKTPPARDVRQLAPKPAPKPAQKPAPKPAPAPKPRPVTQRVRPSVLKPASTPAVKPAVKPAPKPISKPPSKVAARNPSGKQMNSLPVTIAGQPKPVAAPVSSPAVKPASKVFVSKLPRMPMKNFPALEKRQSKPGSAAVGPLLPGIPPPPERLLTKQEPDYASTLLFDDPRLEQAFAMANDSDLAAPLPASGGDAAQERSIRRFRTVGLPETSTLSDRGRVADLQALWKYGESKADIVDFLEPDDDSPEFIEFPKEKVEVKKEDLIDFLTPVDNRGPLAWKEDDIGIEEFEWEELLAGVIPETDSRIKASAARPGSHLHFEASGEIAEGDYTKEDMAALAKEAAGISSLLRPVYTQEEMKEFAREAAGLSRLIQDFSVDDIADLDLETMPEIPEAMHSKRT